ncbi:16494_t:CDS:2, partial [Gigaspora margarita]
MSINTEDPLLLNMNISNKSSIRLPEYIAAILPPNHDYYVNEIYQLPDYITAEGFLVNQFEADLFVNIGSIEGAQQWLVDFEEVSKTMMPQTRCYQIQGKKVIFRQLRHCIHSDIVRQKQENPSLKIPNSLRIRNTDYEISSYNNSGKGYALLQKYDLHSKRAFILCVVTNLMIQVHEKIFQSGEICYVDASASFKLLNTSITLFYTSCIAEALPLGLIVTSNDTGPIAFLTNDSKHKRNALGRLPIRGNNTNNYVEQSFGLLKDIIFARTQAYNCVQVFQFVITSMEHYYERRLLGIAHFHPGHIRIAKRFLCPGWEAIDAENIQQSEINIEFLVPIPCKHQGAIATKYQIGSLNFFPSLMSNDRALFVYIACATTEIGMNTIQANTKKVQITTAVNIDQVTTNVSMDQVTTSVSMDQIATDTNDPEFFETFLRTIKEDYEKHSPQLQAAIEKFAERYNAAKAKSIPALTSFLYNMNRGTDPLVCVKSSAKIRVQVESVKCRKTEAGIKKSSNKKNHDPYIIPARKVRTVDKKKHSL